MELWLGTYNYTLRNTKTNEEIIGDGADKKAVCQKLGLKEYLWRVASKTPIYRTVTTKTNLTNAELIEILSKRDPNAEVDILVDYSLWNSSPDYSFEEQDGLSFVAEDDQLVIFAGDFEC